MLRGTSLPPTAAPLVTAPVTPVIPATNGVADDDQRAELHGRVVEELEGGEGFDHYDAGCFGVHSDGKASHRQRLPVQSGVAVLRRAAPRLQLHARQRGPLVRGFGRSMRHRGAQRPWVVRA